MKHKMAKKQKGEKEGQKGAWQVNIRSLHEVDKVTIFKGEGGIVFRQNMDLGF
jgi:hypothetical protein